MRRLPIAAAAAMLCGFAVASQAADTIVNIPGTAAVCCGGWAPLSIYFDPGEYITTPIVGVYTAYSFGGVPGYGAAYNIAYDQQNVLTFGEGSQGPNLGWPDPETAFARSAVGAFKLEQGQNVYFGVPDSFWPDNVGGVSLRVSAVPEPETFAMMLAGLGLLGLVGRRKQHTA